MTDNESLIDRLAQKPLCGYGAESPAAEPTALTSMALAVHKRRAEADKGAEFLAALQAPDGSIGVREGEPLPAWPTSLAVLTWLAAGPQRFAVQISAAVEWILKAQGVPIKKTKDTELGHNTELIGWSWAANTHSWMEPTILHVLALKAAGKGNHPRVREAIDLLIDRQLPGGGCNYGNTTVLGQLLRPHLQPSGMLLLALAGERDPSGRLEKSVQFVAQAVAQDVTPASLSWAVLGLAAFEKKPADAPERIQSAVERVIKRDAAPYKLALLAHAQLAERSPLVTLPRGKDAR